MDIFSSVNTDEMVTAANTAGFQLATKIEIQELLDSLPLTGGEWVSTYKPLMANTPSRNILWGAYDDQDGDPNRIGYAWSRAHDLAWNYRDNILATDFVTNPVGDGAMTLWAYYSTIRFEGTAPVPEPTTMLLFGTGLIGLAGVSIRRKKRQP